MAENQVHKLKFIVFDFDGTLAELHIDFNEMKRRMAVLAREHLPVEFNSSLPPVLEWMESLAMRLDASNPRAGAEFRRKGHALIREMELEAAHRGRLFDYTRPILLDLRRRGIGVAIITRNCEQAVRIVFPDLEGYCRVFLARDHVPRVKPDPDHLFRALEKAAWEPATTLMVGDHPLDIQTGRRAGVLTAGVSSGRASREDLAGSGANWTAGNCEELMCRLLEEGWI